MTDLELIEKAKAAMKGAYAPYSRFRVGAALEGRSGKVFTGANVENASYGATCCAERVALFKAVTEGERDFTAIAVISDSGSHTFPCGICRQALSEFSPDIAVICANRNMDYEKLPLNELLPHSFSGKDLE